MQIKEYTEEQKEAIKRRLCERVDKSFEVNKYGKGTPLWMNLFFILSLMKIIDQEKYLDIKSVLQLKMMN